MKGVDMEMEWMRARTGAGAYCESLAETWAADTLAGLGSDTGGIGDLCESLAATYGGLENYGPGGLDGNGGRVGEENADCDTGGNLQQPLAAAPVKRGRGRSKRKLPEPDCIAVPAKRGRGRPKKPECVPWRNFTETRQGVVTWICTGGKGRVAVTWDDFEKICQKIPDTGFWSEDSVRGLVFVLAAHSFLSPTKPCKDIQDVFAFIKEAMEYGAMLHRKGWGSCPDCAAEYIMGRRDYGQQS